MKRFTIVICLICAILIQNCSPKKAVIIDVNKPSILFTFEGVKPKFFKSLETKIRKEFGKKGINVGFKYNLKIPPVDNHDYENLPNYTYDKVFDLTWNVNFSKMENRPFKRSEQETHVIYHFSLDLYKTETNERIDNSNETLTIIYIHRYNNSSDLARKLLKKYEKLFRN